MPVEAKSEGTGTSPEFIQAAIRKWSQRDADLTVLDFGCGDGTLVQELTAAGFDAFGCDMPGVAPASERLRDIRLHPYQLPFATATFDVVVSTQVLEHAKNKDECFREIHRVLRSGGHAIHFFPGKWYLPVEPHIHVPLANWFWPRNPRCWFALWARLGIRNEFQAGKPWREVVELNAEYCRTRLSYWTAGQYQVLSKEVFGNFEWPMRFYIAEAPGGVAKLARSLPLKSLSGWLAREFRQCVLLLRKT